MLPGREDGEHHHGRRKTTERMEPRYEHRCSRRRRRISQRTHQDSSRRWPPLLRTRRPDRPTRSCRRTRKCTSERRRETSSTILESETVDLENPDSKRSTKPVEKETREPLPLPLLLRLTNDLVSRFLPLDDARREPDFSFRFSDEAISVVLRWLVQARAGRTCTDRSRTGSCESRRADVVRVRSGIETMGQQKGISSSLLRSRQSLTAAVQTGGDSGAPLATGPPPRAATASPTRASRSLNGPPRFASATPPPFDASKLPARPSIGQGPPPPSLNRSRTAGDLHGQNRLDQARSVSAGPPPPMPGRLMTSPPPVSGASTPVGGARRKPLKSKYVVTPI